MDRLILFRHGKAMADAASGDDFDRALKPRGVAEAAEVAARLAAMGAAPDVALVSAALRTRQTWDAARDAFPAAEVRFDRDLFHADTGVVRRKAGAEAGVVMVVGHNPGLHDLAVRLMVQSGAPAAEISRARQGFPPASAAVFSFDADDLPAFEALLIPERRG